MTLFRQLMAVIITLIFGSFCSIGLQAADPAALNAELSQSDPKGITKSEALAPAKPIEAPAAKPVQVEAAPSAAVPVTAPSPVSIGTQGSTRSGAPGKVASEGSTAEKSTTVPEKPGDWKGDPELSDFSVGALTGMGIINYSIGYTLLGTISKKIVRQGFVADINNSVSIELMFGPVFIARNPTAASPSWIYSAHLRWDFTKDNNWTFFALAGVGGEISSGIVPRIGLGSFFKINDAWYLRGDISHDIIALGINWRP